MTHRLQYLQPPSTSEKLHLGQISYNFLHNNDNVKQKAY